MSVRKYLHILKAGLKKQINTKQYGSIVTENSVVIQNSLNDFLDEVGSSTVVVFVGLRQIKYFGGVEKPAEYIFDLLVSKFKNVIVPTFSPTSVESLCFDVKHTPSESGSFSKYFLSRADFRTFSPFKSFAIIGPVVSDIKQLQFINDFEENGIFEYFIQERIPCINIGTEQLRFTSIHYAEYLKSVPYIRKDMHIVKMIKADNSFETGTYTKVSYRMKYKINRDKIEKELLENRLMVSKNVFGVDMRLLPEDGYLPYFLSKLENNPDYLIE